MDILQITIDAVSDLITLGLSPLPSLAKYGLPYSIFDLAGALRLAFVLRQIREAERSKAQKLQAKLIAGGSDDVRELEEPYFVKDIATILTVIYGGEAVCGEHLCCDC